MRGAQPFPHREKRCLVINVIGPENTGKNVVASLINYKLQQLNECSEFVSNNKITSEQTRLLIESLSPKYDFIVMNGGLSYHLQFTPKETLRYIKHLFTHHVSHLNVLINPSDDGRYDTLEKQYFTSEIRRCLNDNEIFFVQISNRFTDEQLDKLVRYILLYHSFVNLVY